MIILSINVLFLMFIVFVPIGLPFGEASVPFFQLKVGYGIVYQIPSRLISTATRIVVTRAAS